jgi:hypothetical protein
MGFGASLTAVRSQIPSDWWSFCELDTFRLGSSFYPYSATSGQAVEVVALHDIEPPVRDPGLEPFRKYKLVPILLAFRSPECALPPVEVEPLPSSSPFQYRLLNGFHRFYASVAVGYSHIPVWTRRHVRSHDV